jgi:hypothetical protein
MLVWFKDLSAGKELDTADIESTLASLRKGPEGAEEKRTIDLPLRLANSKEENAAGKRNSVGDTDMDVEDTDDVL